MKRLLPLVMVMAFLFLATATSFAQFNYIGVKKCKMCHKTKKSGDQYGKWQERGHSKAYATLATEEAKAVAKKAGVAGDPQAAKECLVCHTTAYDAPAANKAATLTMEEGVSCEACHGPGSEYKSAKVMKGITAGTMKGVDYGLIEASEKVCLSCHNPKSPTYKKFVYSEAIKLVAHPIPAK